MLVEAVEAAQKQPAVVSVPRTPADCQGNCISIQMSAWSTRKSGLELTYHQAWLNPKFYFSSKFGAFKRSQNGSGAVFSCNALLEMIYKFFIELK